MKIDIKRAKEAFIKYTEKFNLENENIEGKQQHSIRVMKISEQLATSMKLKKEQVQLATLIGLLHDIARFEQYTKYKTFKDSESLDHGDYAIEILFKNGTIRKYIETDEYDNIIKQAIKNHNKFKIEDGLSEEKKLFAKLIRDADKIDIIFEMTDIFWKGKEDEVNNSKISEEMWNCVLERKLFKRKKGVNITGIDNVISVILFIFDINFKESLEILYKKNYINFIIDRFNPIYEKEKMKKLRNIANEYVINNVNK